jgi:hypothetical protein
LELNVVLQELALYIWAHVFKIGMIFLIGKNSLAFWGVLTAVSELDGRCRLHDGCVQRVVALLPFLLQETVLSLCTGWNGLEWALAVTNCKVWSSDSLLRLFKFLDSRQRLDRWRLECMLRAGLWDVCVRPKMEVAGSEILLCCFDLYAGLISACS